MAAALSLIPLLKLRQLIVTPSHPDHFVAPVPYHHHCPPVCVHPTTFCCRLPPLLIVKSPLAARDLQCRRHPCRSCRCTCCLCLCLRLCLPPVGCRSARRGTSCWSNSVGNGICATDGLLCAPQTTITAREQEGRGGEDDLEPPTAEVCPPSSLPQLMLRSSCLRPHPSLLLLFHCRDATGQCTARRGKKAVPRPWPWQVPSSTRACLCQGGCGGGTRSLSWSRQGGGQSPLLLILLPPTKGPHDSSTSMVGRLGGEHKNCG